MFWGFLVKLLISSWVAPYLLVGVMLPVILIVRNTRPTHAAARIVNETVQCLFWAGWAAFCVLSARNAVANPEARYWLLYYAVAAIAAVGPIRYLTRRARAEAKTHEDDQFVATATTRYWSVCVLAFGLFCVSPDVALGLFGWLPGL